jgi:DNA-binding MarR family transcriptional regulator
MRTELSEIRPEIASAAREVCRAATTFAARARSERAGVLSLNETAVLGQLSKSDALTPGEIGRRLGSRPQALTRTFAALELAGQVERVTDPADGRQSLLTITDDGRAALRDEMRPRVVWTTHVIEGLLSDAEREILVVASGLLERLAAATPDGAVPGGA